MRKKVGLPILFSALFLLSACGGAKAEYRSVSNNKNLVVTIETQASLSAMESSLFVSEIDSQNCNFSYSPYQMELLAVIETLNSNSLYFSEIKPSLNLIELRGEPPREEGTVAVFICDGLGSDVFTLYRSIFISNSFIDALKDEALFWDDESLFFPALSYLVYHELGHAAYNHSALKFTATGNGEFYSFDLPQEMEADSFAYDLMVLTKQNLLGMMMAQSLASRR